MNTPRTLAELAPLLRAAYVADWNARRVDGAFSDYYSEAYRLNREARESLGLLGLEVLAALLVEGGSLPAFLRFARVPKNVFDCAILEAQRLPRSRRPFAKR